MLGAEFAVVCLNLDFYMAIWILLRDAELQAFVYASDSAESVGEFANRISAKSNSFDSEQDQETPYLLQIFLTNFSRDPKNK